MRFCGAVGTVITSRAGGGGGEVDDGEEEASGVGRLDQRSCATLPTGLVGWGNDSRVEDTGTSSARGAMAVVRRRAMNVKDNRQMSVAACVNLGLALSRKAPGIFDAVMPKPWGGGHSSRDYVIPSRGTGLVTLQW